MTPVRIMVLLDRRTRRQSVIRVPFTRHPPEFVEPPRPEEVKDSRGIPAPVVPSKVKDGAGTLNNRKPS